MNISKTLYLSVSRRCYCYTLSQHITYQPWIMFSSTFQCDFRSVTVISDDLRVRSNVFEVISGKNIVEEMESIMSSRKEPSSPSWVCIPQKSLAIARAVFRDSIMTWCKIINKTPQFGIPKRSTQNVLKTFSSRNSSKTSWSKQIQERKMQQQINK